MSFINAMQSRYTTKKYDPTKKIDPKKIEELKKILQLSPSSINSQPWLFTFVSNQEKKEELSKVSWHNTEKILDCDTVVVLSKIKDIELFEKQINFYLPEGAIAYYNEFIKGNPAHEIQAWFEKQVYLSLGILLSACAEMEIDATPMEGIEPEKYDEILGNDNYTTVVAVAIGHRAEDDFNQPEKKPKSRKDLEEVIWVI